MRRLVHCLCLLILMTGCSTLDALTKRSKTPEEPAAENTVAKRVGDLAVPFGMHPLGIEAVGFVTGLQGTGSDPGPSPQRAELLAEMQTRGVKNPNTLLASPDTSLVLIRAFMRPGIQKGDRFDVEVVVPQRSETTSLRNGYLLESRMQQMGVFRTRAGTLERHSGHVLALAEGPIMVDPSADKTNRVAQCRGRILGGGVALKARPLGLALKPDRKSVANSALAAAAVNKRFHTFDRGIKVGVAKAKTDTFIELVVHPRYKDNIVRYFQVLGTVALSESEAQRVQRIAELKQQLLDPTTAAGAALELEGIGATAADALLAGAASKDPEVRFHAAEALAYLDRREAAEPLAEAARNVPAFRVFALSALSVMSDFAAQEKLRELLAAPSAETRYGAFRALWTMNSRDPLVMGEELGGRFSYHVLNTPDPPMIHVTRNRRAEVVLFGQDQRLRTPVAVNAGGQIMVTGSGGNEIAVSKFAVGDADQKRVVSNRVDEVVRAIVELGGTYPDVVQALQEARAAGALEGRFEVDALPEAGRVYHRGGQEEVAEGDGGSIDADGPAEGEEALDLEENTAENGDSDPGEASPKGFFAKIMGRGSD